MALKISSNRLANRFVEPLLREPVVRRVLPNGLAVLIRPDHSAEVASVQVWIKTGSIHEDRWLGGGISHYLEHMLFKGTGRRAGRDISAEVQAHGGYINAYTSLDRTVYYIDVPSEHAEVALDVLGDAVFHSTLPAAEVVKERDVILREIDMGLDDPDHRVTQALMEAAFREHPYRHPIIGHRDVFAQLSREDLVAYHRARYVPDNAALVIAGAVDPETLWPAIERHFGAPARRALLPLVLPEEPAQLADRRIDIDSDVQVFRASLALPAPGLAHPDTPALDVLALVLGQGDSSLLWRGLRERRNLVQSIDASNWSPASRGLFYISLVADLDKGERALEAVREEIRRACDRGFTADQLRKAVRQTLVAEVNARRTMAGQAGRLGVAETVVGDLDFSARYLERLARLGVADLDRVARAWLRDAPVTVATLRPRVAPAAVAVRRAAAGLDFAEAPAPGGIRLLVRENDRLPKVHLRIAWEGGPLFDPPGREGATSLLAVLLAKDTRTRTAAAVAAAIEAAGGSFTEFSGNNSFGLSIEVLPSDLDLALELLREAVLRPAFRASTLAREREATLAAIAEGEDDVVTATRRRLRAAFFAGHPFAFEPDGAAASVARIDAATLRAHHRALVVSGNTVLAVSGAVEAAVIRRRLKGLLAAIPRGERPVASGPKGWTPAVGEHLHPMDRQQVVVMEAYPMGGLRAGDFHVTEVADELFSGMSSNLFERVRERKSLAYFVRSSRIVGLSTGMFFLMAGTNPEGRAEVLAEFARELERVRRGRVGADELARCKTRLKSGRRMSLQSNAACASQAALNALYGLPVNDRREYDERIDAVTVDDLARFARECLAPARRMRVLGGATGQL